MSDEAKPMTFAEHRRAAQRRQIESRVELIREQAARPNGLGVALTAQQQQDLERSNLRWQQRSAWAPVVRGGGGRMSEEFADLRAKFERQRVAAEESMRELQSQGYAWEPPQPEHQYCACGQELRGVATKHRPASYRQCGDCDAQGVPYLTAPKWAPLGERIAAAKSADLDPTSEWGAGATPGYDWEGR